MTFPTAISYGSVPSTRTYGPIDQMCRDLEAISTTLLAYTGNMADGGAIIGDQAVVGGTFYLAAALGGSRTLTLPVTATAGSRILIMRSDVTATTLALGTVFTMPASKAGVAMLCGDGTNWILEDLVLDGKIVYCTTGNCKIVAAAAGVILTLAAALTTTGGAVTLTVPVAGATVAVAGNVTTTGGALTVAGAVAGSTLTMANSVEFSGAFKPTFASVAATTITLPAVSITLAPGTALAPVVACPARAGNDYIPLDIENGKTYVLGDGTGAASTVTLPVAAADGTRAYWILDGTLNGHTVQFRDANGPRVCTPAIAASKHVLATIVKFGGAWYVDYTVEP